MRNPVKLLFMALFFGSCSFSIFSGQIFTAEDADGNLIASDQPITPEQKKAVQSSWLAQNSTSTTKNSNSKPFVGQPIKSPPPPNVTVDDAKNAPAQIQQQEQIEKPTGIQNTNQINNAKFVEKEVSLFIGEEEAKKQKETQEVATNQPVAEAQKKPANPQEKPLDSDRQNFGSDTMQTPILKPFGDFQWEDNIIDVFKKLKAIPSVKYIGIKLCGTSYGENIEERNILQVSDSALESWVKKEIIEYEKRIWFQNEDELSRKDRAGETLILKDKRKIFYHSGGFELTANPIFLAGIPFNVHFSFESVPGYVLTNPEKGIMLEVDGKEIIAIHGFRRMDFVSSDKALYEAHKKELWGIFRQKYPGMKDDLGRTAAQGARDFIDEQMVNNGDYCVSIGPGPYSSEGMISYENSCKSIEAAYTNHRNAILTNENKSNDSSSGL